MSILGERKQRTRASLRQTDAFSVILILGVAAGRALKGVTLMVDITVKMNATTFIFVVLIVLAALRSGNK